MNAPAPSTLAERVERHLDRQIAWLEAAIAIAADAQTALAADEPDLDACAAHVARQGAELGHLLREHHALQREWEGGAAHAAPAARDAIAARSARMIALRDELRTREEALAAAIADRAGGNRAAQDALGRGRHLIGRYRPGAGGPGFIDRKG